jgi:hypothetical protein
MKWVQRIQTRDGMVHETEKAAKRHAEARYADKLLPLSHKLIAQRLGDLAGFVDANLDKFLELKALKDDIELIPTEGE